MTAAILRDPLRVPSNWRGCELVDSDAWIHRLTREEVADLESALAAAKATGKPMNALTREDFPLGALARPLAAWLQELAFGRGFLNVKGIPVERHSDDDAIWMLWGLGLHMGIAVSQNAAGDLLGHVRDTGADARDPNVRLYKTNAELAFHSDGADVVALLCLRQGKSGGENKFVSTTALYAELCRRRPDLIELLYQPFYFDSHGQQSKGQKPYFKLPICHYDGKRLSFFHLPWYIRNAQRHPEVPRLTADQHALLDLIDEVADDPALHLAMRLEPGEINLLKNNTALHARTAYVDWDEEKMKRHLLRLWLTPHEDGATAHPGTSRGIPAKPGVRSDAETIADS